MNHPIRCDSKAPQLPILLGLDADNTDAKPIPILQCSSCELAYSDLSSHQLNNKALYFDGYYGEKTLSSGGKQFLVSLFQVERRQIALSGLEPGRILDIGCGDGTFLRYLPHQWDRFGYETSEPGRAQMKADKIPFLDIYSSEAKAFEKSFDVITLWQSFEHIPDPSEVLTAARRLLKPGGRLFISVPNFRSFQSRLFGARWFHLDPTRHLFHYSKDTLSKVLRQNGFEVSFATTFSLEYGVFGWWQSFFNLLPMEFNKGYKIIKARKKYAFSIGHLRDLVVYGLLALPIAFVSGTLMLIETLFHRGGVVQAIARDLTSTRTGPT